MSDNTEAVRYVVAYAQALLTTDHRASLDGFRTFLPPRLVSAGKTGSLVPFFGSGISVSAGVPTWQGLLERLGVSPELSKEPQLENDPLTTAELLAHEIGASELQRELRRVMLRPRTPTLVHHLLAQLCQPVYVTSNYDRLFEIAWATVHGGSEPFVVTTDSDFARHGLDPNDPQARDDRPILLKIHGCAKRDEEQLILTRSQYRRHYRSNTRLFDALKKLLFSRHTLFLGFGHRDPEITRLVEDVIHKYETQGGSPALYSLQFDMKERTPEVFAARGIVALQPPISLDAPNGFDYRSAGVTKALIDLNGAMDSAAHGALHLDDELSACVTALHDDLEGAMERLKNAVAALEPRLDDTGFVEQELAQVLQDLGPLAGQGVYLLRENGDILQCSLPPALTAPERRQAACLHDRFYVQQARTFRQPFVSDSDASKFNRQSTFFLCRPLGDVAHYKGLLFSAAQVGAWTRPLQLKADFLQRHPQASFVLVDSNGVALVPPNDELRPGPPPLLPTGETDTGNHGFGFEALRRLSRRDRLVSRVWRNIVPLAQDDDVETFSDLRMYSVVSEVPPTRWKLALSIPL